MHPNRLLLSPVNCSDSCLPTHSSQRKHPPGQLLPKTEGKERSPAFVVEHRDGHCSEPGRHISSMTYMLACSQRLHRIES